MKMKSIFLSVYIKATMKKLTELLKELYIKIKCYMCCRSKCSIQVGQQQENQE